MTENDIIVAGEEVKYFIDIEHDGFSMLENDFQVEIVYGMRGESFTLTKQEMTADSSGKYFFMFSTAGMVGKVKAICTFWVPDTDDSDDSVREIRDEQIIAFVTNTPCLKLMCCPKDCGGTGFVTYERTEESGIASMYQRLCTAQGQPIVTDDDLYLYVLTEAIPEIQEALDNLINENAGNND